VSSPSAKTAADLADSARRVIGTGIARAETLRGMLRIAQSAVSSGSPLAAPITDAIGAVEESISILARGHLGDAELDQLAAAARRVEKAVDSLQLLVLLPGPIGMAGRAIRLLRYPLGAWARYIARDPARPDVPSPLELAAGGTR
jgi:hypothetical protein